MRRQTRYHLRRLTRRILWFVLLPALLLLALRLIWGVEAAHCLQKVRDQIRAAGIHMDVTDFPDDSTIPPDQNGIYDFIEAINLFSPTSAEDDAIGLVSHEEPFLDAVPTPAEAAEIQRILIANKPVMDLLDRAGARRTMVLPRAVLGPLLLDYMTENSITSKARSLVNLCFHAAVAAQARHDEVEELACFERMLTVSRAADRYPGTIAHLVAVACRTLASQTVERLEPALSLNDAASRAGAHRLIAKLQDESELAASLVRTAPAEQISDADMLYKYGAAWRAWWIRPLFDRETAAVLADTQAQSPTLRAANWPRAVDLLRADPYREPDNNLDKLVTQLEGYLSVTWYRPMLLHVRCLSDSRAVSLLLAAHLYAADHGNFPPDTAALVPDYLAAIPLDPFADGPPLHYRLDPAGPTVWSVSENGVDDNAAVRFDSSGGKLQRYGDRPISQGDIIYGAAWRTAVPPTQPATAP